MFARIASIILLLCLCCCHNNQQAAQDKTGRKPLILTSIPPYQFLLKQIVQDYADIATIVPNHADPHSFEPTPRQLAHIHQGNIWFRIGEPFEEKLCSLFQDSQNTMRVYDLRENISLISVDEHPLDHCTCNQQFDRHIWLSPNLLDQQAQRITSILMQLLPEHSAAFEANYTKVHEELTQLDSTIKKTLHSLQHRAFVVSHPAFHYFCRDYNLEQLSIEQEGKEPRPQHLQHIVSQAQEKCARLAIGMPQHNNKGAQLVAEQLHIPLCTIDPYAETYLITMHALMRALAQANGELP